jgi:hypothetical protein
MHFRPWQSLSFAEAFIVTATAVLYGSGPRYDWQKTYVAGWAVGR